jgi:hypothetical protein
VIQSTRFLCGRFAISHRRKRYFIKAPPFGAQLTAVALPNVPSLANSPY